MKQGGNAQAEIEVLLKRFRDGADDAFSELCERFSPMLGVLVSRFSDGGAYEAELAQEARIALYRAAMTYASADGAVTFGLYARVCVRNALLSCLRSHSKDADLYSLDELDGVFLPEDEEPLESLITAETVADIYRKARTVLSSFERRVFDLYLEEESTEKMAKALGKSEKSVRNAIQRVRAKLKAAL